MSPRPPRRLPSLLAVLAFALDPPASASVAGHGEAACRSPQPKTAFLNYFWHREKQFDCYLVKPRWNSGRGIDSSDTAYYSDRFERLARHGVDVLGFVFTGFEAEADEESAGRFLQTSFDGGNLRAAIPEAEALGLPFFIYYDLKVRTAVKSRICRLRDPSVDSCPNPDHEAVRTFNLKKNGRQLYDQLKEDFIRIKNDFILPHLDGYYMLEDEQGNRMLDATGLPRPVIGIYIARNLDANGLSQLVREVTRAYRADGLGQPAFLLDVIWWYDRKRNDPESRCVPMNVDGTEEDLVSRRILRKFGSAAAAATSFFPVGAVHARECGITDMRGWADEMGGLFANAARQFSEHPEVSHVQVWPGLSSQFDNGRRNLRRCESSRQKEEAEQSRFRLRDIGDWDRLLRMGYGSARVPPVSEQCDREPRDRDPLPQTLLVIYDNEFRESAVVDCATGNTNRPDFESYRFGCALLDGIEERDRSHGFRPQRRGR